ncbi:centriolar satellite-associated tubulin polyglutamylase complex regulator 1-like isoform X2 [Watersipora subatra]|uniref:centriolar satellite-associated tubulin polyglutamylase complex regulator 1-like isoform X2 n=1 Tax=Watersipora subatra TaxID=2589382 RepID=UPI00355B48D4
MARELSTTEYLNHNHILTYVEDAITQLLNYRSDLQPSKVDVNRFLAQYFSCLKEGRHVLFREFAFINATPFNRACFIETFLKCFAVLGKKGDLLTIREYYALVSILCNDFPYEILQNTAKIVLIDDAHDCLIAFTDFLYSFQLQFYYQEFLETSHLVYQSLLGENQSPRDIVVPTDHMTDHMTEVVKEKLPAQNSSDGVDSMKFYRSLSQLPDKHKFSIPSLSALKEILSAAPSVTFYGFLVALSKSEAINTGIGKLPSTGQIFDEVDLNLDLTPFERTSQDI